MAALSVQRLDGDAEGLSLGERDGALLGSSDGALVGSALGCSVGLELEGEFLGERVTLARLAAWRRRWLCRWAFAWIDLPETLWPIRRGRSRGDAFEGRGERGHTIGSWLELACCGSGSSVQCSGFEASY